MNLDLDMSVSAWRETSALAQKFPFAREKMFENNCNLLISIINRDVSDGFLEEFIIRTGMYHQSGNSFAVVPAIKQAIAKRCERRYGCGLAGFMAKMKAGRAINLSGDLVVHLAGFCDIQAIGRMLRVSKLWLQVLDQPSTWKKIVDTIGCSCFSRSLQVISYKNQMELDCWRLSIKEQDTLAAAHWLPVSPAIDTFPSKLFNACYAIFFQQSNLFKARAHPGPGICHLPECQHAIDYIKKCISKQKFPSSLRDKASPVRRKIEFYRKVQNNRAHILANHVHTTWYCYLANIPGNEQEVRPKHVYTAWGPISRTFILDDSQLPGRREVSMTAKEIADNLEALLNRLERNVKYLKLENFK